MKYTQPPPCGQTLHSSNATGPRTAVLDAVEAGAQSREAIQTQTGLSFDAIGDALLVLVWDLHLVEIERLPDGGRRLLPACRRDENEAAVMGVAA